MRPPTPSSQTPHNHNLLTTHISTPSASVPAHKRRRATAIAHRFACVNNTYIFMCTIHACITHVSRIIFRLSSWRRVGKRGVCVHHQHMILFQFITHTHLASIVSIVQKTPSDACYIQTAAAECPGADRLCQAVRGVKSTAEGSCFLHLCDCCLGPLCALVFLLCF